MDNLFVGRDLLIASLLLQVPLVQQVILEKFGFKMTFLKENRYVTVLGMDRTGTYSFYEISAITMRKCLHTMVPVIQYRILITGFDPE
jgi:hypothetical protein